MTIKIVKLTSYILLLLVLNNCFYETNNFESENNRKDFQKEDTVQHIEKLTIINFLQDKIKSKDSVSCMIIINAQHCITCQSEISNIVFNKIGGHYNSINIVIFESEKYKIDVSEYKNTISKYHFFDFSEAFKYELMYPETMLFIIKKDIIETELHINYKNYDEIISTLAKYEIN
jgi:hypothetical protein